MQTIYGYDYSSFSDDVVKTKGLAGKTFFIQSRFS